MNSWEIIRKQMVKCRLGSVGEIVDVNKACDLFVALNDAGLLMDSKEACNSFNKDESVAKSLLHRGMVDALKECT